LANRVVKGCDGCDNDIADKLIGDRGIGWTSGGDQQSEVRVGATADLLIFIEAAVLFLKSRYMIQSGVFNAFPV